MRPKQAVPAETVAGALLTGGSLLVLVGAGLPDWRVFTSPDRRVQLEAIAARRWGWIAQAILFPTAFGIVAAGLASAATLRPLGRQPAQRVTELGALLGGAAALLWLPISYGAANRNRGLRGVSRRHRHDAAVRRLAALRHVPRGAAAGRHVVGQATPSRLRWCGPASRRRPIVERKAPAAL